MAAPETPTLIPWPLHSLARACVRPALHAFSTVWYARAHAQSVPELDIKALNFKSLYAGPRLRHRLLTLCPAP